MTDKRRPISLLPAIHQTEALKRFFGSTVDHLFQPGQAQAISGYIGRIPSYFDATTDFYKPEPTAARTKYQLEAAMVSSLNGTIATALFYNDLISRMGAIGANTSNTDRLFQSEYWSWAPPVDIDKINNFQQYYWSDSTVPALDLTLPGMETPAVYRAISTNLLYAMPRAIPCMRVLPERHITGTTTNEYDPCVLVNGALASFTITSGKILLDTPAQDGDIVEVYRYGNVGNGTRTDFSFPTPFNNTLEWTNADVHVYINGRQITEYTVLSDRVVLNAPAAANSIVTVTLFDSIKALCTGATTFNISNLNYYNVTEMINGLKVNLIDPSVYFLGYGVNPYDTFKWDEKKETHFFVDGVGSAIRLSEDSYPSLEAQYVTMDRRDTARSYWSVINRWVTGEALAWFAGKTSSRQAKRPICEYISQLQLFNYGNARAPDTDAFFGVIAHWSPVPFTAQLTDDTGRTLSAGDIVLFGDVGDPDLNNKFFIWPTIDDQTNPSSIALIPLRTATQGEVVKNVSTNNEYRFDSGIWIKCQTFGDFPLFDLYDNNGVSIGDDSIYPLNNFSGSRIFCFQIGTGNNDSLLGFPAVYDEYGQIVFENDLYTKSYSWREGDFIGFQYYRVGNTFHNQWYKASNLLPATESQPEIIIPLNLQANPNFATPQFISKNNWFKHFSSIVQNQETISGASYSANNWSDTARDLSKGTQIIQSYAPLLKLMLLVGENGFDLQRAITYAENEYVRLKLKIRQKIKLGIDNGTYTTGLNPITTITSILQMLNSNKSGDFAFFLSSIGGGTYFIPPTPATLNIIPMVTPRQITENGEQFILGHDGSKSASVDQVTDSIMLAFENLIFSSRQTAAYRPDTRPLVDEIDLVEGKFRTGAYSRSEANALMQGSFEEWVRTNGVNYQENTTYDYDNPFTWNYSGLTDRDGEPLPGNWRAIYRHYFDTETPNTTPWEMLGFNEQPEWWAARYGLPPYNRSSPMWQDIEAGLIAEGTRAGTDIRFARPNLIQFLPIDPTGNLIDPVTARIVDRSPTTQIAEQRWVFGDGGPVETLWRRSSSFGFARAQSIFLMRPAQFVEMYWDTDNRKLVHDQWIDVDTNDRASHSELIVHGELVDGIAKVSFGIQNWLVEYMISRGQKPVTLGDFIRGLDVRLSHKMAGYTTPDRMNVTAESFGLIPSEDVSIELYRSPGLLVDSYSGILIEFLRPSHWRVIGYNGTNPSFTIRPIDPNGNRIDLTGATDRVVNPWISNVYYKAGVFVLYDGVVYSALKNHMSGQIFEPDFWHADGTTMSGAEKLYRYIDYDGSTESVPYATVMQSRQEVINFLVAYERDLVDRGFIFEDGVWDDAVNQFINWSSVDWVSGTFLTVSPGARSIRYSTSQGYILDLNDPFTTNSILNRSGLAIDNRNIQIDRLDGDLMITATARDDIYGLTIRKAEIEHILVFSNRTIFNDIIFDPVFNVRQARLHLSARRSTNWSGRYDAPGFMLVNGQMVNNFEKSADDVRYMFDIELADNTVLRDHSRHMIGFTSRDYMNNLLVNNTQQFEFYQGMIQEKGSAGVLNKIMRSKAIEGDRQIKFLEEWAFKLGEFGANEPRGYVELALSQDDVNRQTQLIHLDAPIVAEWGTSNFYDVGDFVTYSNIVYEARTRHIAASFLQDLQQGKWIVDATKQASSRNSILSIDDSDPRWKSSPLKFSDLGIADHSGFNGIADAGYVRLGETTYISSTFDNFTTDMQAYLQNGGSYVAGQSIWVYRKGLQDWSVENFEYPTNLFSSGNLVVEDLTNGLRWQISRLNAVPSSVNPTVIPDARWIAYVDGTGSMSQLSSSLTSSSFSVVENQVYSTTVDTFVTENFNGTVTIRISWFNGSTLLGSEDSLLDYTTEAPRSFTNKIVGLVNSPTGATSGKMAILVTYGTNSPSAGRVYFGNPTMRYADEGVVVTRVDTADTNSDVFGTRYTVSHPHNFEVSDLVIIAGPINLSYEGTGAFEVVNVGTDWFEVDLMNTLQAYDFATNGEIGPSVFRLGTARFGTKPDAMTSAISGTLSYVDDRGDGTWAVYRAPDFTNALRLQPTSVIDMNKVASVLVYDNNTKIGDDVLEPEPVILSRINPVDPLCGVMIGAADREIDFKLEYDPAIYNTDENIWGADQLGRVWWDTSTVWYINPYTDDLSGDKDKYLKEITYRANNWAKIAPGSTIDLYEWTKSKVEPSKFTGSVYSVDEFVTVTEYDASVSHEVTFYYFWVKNPTTTPITPFRNLDLATCARIIANPALAGVPWMAVISDKDIIFSGLRDYLTNDTVVQTLLQLTDSEEDLPHVEWKLVRPNDETSQPPAYFWSKMRNSLVGFDDNLNAIPNPDLYISAQTGIGHGQSMFDSAKMHLARSSFITMINYQLARRNLSLDPNFGSHLLTFSTPIPVKLSWVLLDGEHTFATLPPSLFYDIITSDPAELSDLLNTNPEGYRVLLDNRFSNNPSWTVWVKNSGNYEIANAYQHRISSRNALNSLSAQIGDLILIEEDSLYGNFWTIVRKDSNVYTVVWTQTYDTTPFWSYTDWYDNGYSADSPPIVYYDTITQRNLAENPQPTNLLVKILDNGSGQWTWTAYQDGNWKTVARELGTVKLSDKFFTSSQVYGWAAGNYQYDYTKLFARDGSFELRFLFDSLINNILTPMERNELWFSMVNFIHAHHDQVDWAIKTSFLTIVGYNEYLLPNPTTHPDNTKNILSYVDEVKPYHVTVRDFERNFAVSDHPNITVTDFDKPSYYDPNLRIYRRLDRNNPLDLAIMESGSWQYWLNNPDMVRQISVDMLIDRVWFEDTEDSGAAHRIISFYNPNSDMTPKDLNKLLKLDFQGTLIDDMSFNDIPVDSVNQNTNGNFSDGSDGYRMRDPRVTINTPEELVRLGSHDVFQCHVSDKWGEGAPMSIVKYFDVSNEILDVVTLNISSLVRDIVVFGDGQRLNEGVHYTFDQFSAQVNVTLGTNPSRFKTISVHGFGYAAHTAVIGQITLLASGGSQIITIPANIVAEGSIAAEVTANRNPITSTITGNTLNFVAGANQEIVITFYKGSAKTTRLVDIKLPMKEGPSGPTNTAAFDGTFQLNQLPLTRPLASSIIVEKNGLRLYPGIVTHIYYTNLYLINASIPDPTQIRIVDDTGTTSAVEIYGNTDFSSIDQAIAYTSTSRFSYWNNYIILRDSNSASRIYHLSVNGTGEYQISENGILEVFSMHREDLIRVLFWRNDKIMKPQTWSFRSHEDGQYQIVTSGRIGSSWLTLGGKRLVENVDYTISETTAGAWGVNPYGTFGFSNTTTFDIALKHPNGNLGDVVITTFEGPEASPAIEWQSSTTTPSIYRFRPNPQYVMGESGPLLLEYQSWETSAEHELGTLVSEIVNGSMISTIELTLAAPDVMMIPDLENNIPGVFWLGAERIEYFSIQQTGNIVTFEQVRRGTRCTPMLGHLTGETATVHNELRPIPRAPIHGLEVPSGASVGDTFVNMSSIPQFTGWFLKVHVAIATTGVSSSFDVARLNFPTITVGSVTADFCDNEIRDSANNLIVQRSGTPYNFTYTFFVEPNLVGEFSLDVLYPVSNWSGAVGLTISYEMFNQTSSPFNAIQSTVISNAAINYPFGVSPNA